MDERLPPHPAEVAVPDQEAVHESSATESDAAVLAAGDRIIAAAAAEGPSSADSSPSVGTSSMSEAEAVGENGSVVPGLDSTSLSSMARLVSCPASLQHKTYLQGNAESRQDQQLGLNAMKTCITESITMQT